MSGTDGAPWDVLCAAVLGEGDAVRKAALAEDALGRLDELDVGTAPGVARPGRPARPPKPRLVPPQDVPRRGLGSRRGRLALLHALAHIELNAVDLAADMALRFAGELPDAERARFVHDWLTVAGEEGLHFRLLCERLAELGGAYGDLAAHDGLWEAAVKTGGDVLARLAVAPMVLEARGLDVTPGLIGKLTALGDDRTASVLERIYRDEIGHVRTGVHWFRRLAAARGRDPETAFHALVRTYYPAGPKPPFNAWARRAAEMPEDWYLGAVPE